MLAKQKFPIIRIIGTDFSPKSYLVTNVLDLILVRKYSKLNLTYLSNIKLNLGEPP